MPSSKLASGALAATLAACVAYQPGSVRRSAPDGAAVAEGGCLEVAAAVTDDAVAAWPVVDLAFGNRCARPVPVDLRALAVVGHTRAGATVALVPYDPRGELRPLPLEARSRGGERLQYRDGRDLGVVGDDVVAVCLDLAPLAGAAMPAARCFSRPATEAPAGPTAFAVLGVTP